MSRAPWLIRFGGTVSVATFVALVGSIPAALRMSAVGDVSVFRAWFALAGLAVGPALLLVPLARLAREGLRGFAPTDEPHALERLGASMVFACTWLWLLTAFGAQLRDKTHHRALGAVTFAIIAFVSGVFLALVARRLAAILSAIRAKREPLGLLLTTLAILLPAAVLAMRVARASPFLGTEARAVLVDGLAFALALAFFARKIFDDRRLLSWLGPPAAVILLVMSMHTLATSQTATSAMEHACPVHFALLEVFAHLAV